MPVLMNKGDNPRLAAWIFYTDRDTFAELGRAIREERADAGLLVVDEADVDAAKKASSTLPVYLQVTATVPPEVDLDALAEEAMTAAQHVVEAQEAGDDGADEGADEGEGEGEGADAPDASADAPSEGEGEEPKAAWEPIAVPEGQGARILAGTTTLEAARDFIQRRELGGEEWKPELPGVQAIAGMAELMAAHGGIPAWLIWHEDASGVMRMAPAKTVKPMAGNILKVKL